MSATETKKLSFELHEDMFTMISEEFDPEKVAEQYAKEVKGNSPDTAAQTVFGAYGKNLAKRSLQLGNEYSDRTYEVMLEMVDHTGGAYKFPLLPQRFLEIVYLSVLDRFAFPVRVNSSQEFIFEIDDCPIFEALKTKCEKKDIENIPCRQGCINLIRDVFQFFDLDIMLEAQTSPGQSNLCVFRVTKGL